MGPTPDGLCSADASEPIQNCMLHLTQAHTLILSCNQSPCFRPPGFLAYFAAEALSLSAILAVFFAGIAMSHYTWHSLSPAAKVISRHGFHVVAALCETVLFVYAGLDMW